MKRKAKQYLEYSSWPAKDKALWKAAFAAGTDLFDESGPGAHLAERTIQQLQYTYGKFLYFLAIEHPELLDHAPADRVDTKTVAGFVGSQPASCGAITLGIYLYHLWLAIIFVPKAIGRGCSSSVPGSRRGGNRSRNDIIWSPAIDYIAWDLT